MPIPELWILDNLQGLGELYQRWLVSLPWLRQERCLMKVPNHSNAVKCRLFSMIFLWNHQTLDTNHLTQRKKSGHILSLKQKTLFNCQKLPEAETFANQERNLGYMGLHGLRGQAQKALEEARNAKVIGKSLEAHDSLPKWSGIFLEQWTAMWLNFWSCLNWPSQKDQLQKARISFEDVTFTVERATGEVCERCRRDPTTAERSYHAVICDHC